MWRKLAIFVLQYKRGLLLCLLISTVMMGFLATKVKLSYEFAKAIPANHPVYKDYLSFKEKFGDDGNTVVIGVQSNTIFELPVFLQYRLLHQRLKQVADVEDVMSVPFAVNLYKDSLSEKLVAKKIFSDSIKSQPELDSAKNVFFNLPFYQLLLYNPQTHAYLMGVRINPDSLNSVKRTAIIAQINTAVLQFQSATKIETHVSGLPLIRTVVADRIQKEMRFFLIASLLLSVFILFLFFRSAGNTVLSMLVVIAGVIWTVGIMYIMGYKISLLTALAPPLVVVIGIPNCIYFINKYHTAYLQTGNKTTALIEMVSKMGVVTLFCNLTAAIGFAVFAFTQSSLLKEFGVVAGLSIMFIFVISFILLPAVLSYLPAPKPKQLKYLDNRWVTGFLFKIEHWVLHHKKIIYTVTIMLILFSAAGMLRLKSEAHIVDDLPKTDKIYTDLKFFEANFKGVMPLDIVISTSKPRGISGMKSLRVFEKVDSLAQFIKAQPNMSRPLSIAEALKFAKQAFYEGDSLSYVLPNNFDGAFVGDYLRAKNNDSIPSKDNLSKIMRSFLDSQKQTTRMSIGMADIGTRKLPEVLDSINQRAHELFDSSYTVKLTGTSITFLEGSKFIINGLKESIFWAFLLIAVAMFYLFKSFRILYCSLIPNLIPLLVTAGIMGWFGINLKPSTVLIFSVALGIAVDITIRFLVNYKQELPGNNNNTLLTVSKTIQQTGLSIIYTSLVLIAGFVIFCASSFGGTFALGWLTSLTLLIATITNLVLLPVLLVTKK